MMPPRLLDMARALSDRLLGRGEAAVSVPPMDGVLQPNRTLDEAEVVAGLEGIDDLATTGETLWIAAGRKLLRMQAGAVQEACHFEQPITALASDGTLLALALDGAQVQLRTPDGRVIDTLQQIDHRPLRGVNALAHDPQRGGWLFTEGSAQHAPADWCQDLMRHGATGRACLWTPGAAAQILCSGLRHAFGILPGQSGGFLLSESWAHRVLHIQQDGARTALLAQLPAYPSRMAVARHGGVWLSCFVCRTQLVEFVLRENGYRKRMLEEMDPRHWIAPALSSGNSFLEPLQGAGVKQMGVLKPWAPPRSYGLVLRVDARGEVCASLHSQADGQHHGITALAELDNGLYIAAKGAGKLLRIRLEDAT